MRIILFFVLLFAICSCNGIVSAIDGWWEYGHFYQIYPRSFQDSDGDGIGDVNGITSRLSHLKDIGVDGVWLSPIFASPMLDMGYDISNFRKIHHEFGSMDDFDRLLGRCKELGIKLILDFVPNHTSDQHDQKSIDPDHPEHEKYKDYYIWNEGKLLENGTRVPPSNWLSIFKGSMWTWVKSRHAFYLHQFMTQQPDLNFRNAAVSEEMKEVLRFWLRKGVSGFRIDAVPHLFEVEVNADGLYDDEPLSGKCKDKPNDDCYLEHTKTQFLNETYDMIYQWRSVMDEDEFKNHTRILMTEAYGNVPKMVRFYGEVKNGEIVRKGVQIPFDFQLMLASKRWSPASKFIDMINTWIDSMPKGEGIHPNWLLGNHDRTRIASKYGPNPVDIFNILLKTLPGITITYNGEEIGMTAEFKLSSIDFRFPNRTPMQWDNTTSAGFSTNPKTWLPVASNYKTLNVKLQQSQEISHLKVFQQLTSLRKNPTFKYGSLTLTSTKHDKLLVYKREIKDDPNADVFVVVLNLSMASKYSKVNLDSILGDLPEEMTVLISTVHSNRNGQVIDTKRFNIGRYSGVVLVGKKGNN